MKTAAIFIFVFILSGWALWGCPSKKYIPDPLPPEPHVQNLEETPGYRGRVPPAGLRVHFRRMIAAEFTRPYHQVTISI